MNFKSLLEFEEKPQFPDGNKTNLEYFHLFSLFAFFYIFGENNPHYPKYFFLMIDVYHFHFSMSTWVSLTEQHSFVNQRFIQILL